MTPAFPTVTVTCKPCFACGEQATVEVAEDGYRRWQAGAFVQVAFPEMPKEQRELLVSGIHPACWERLFGSEEE